MFLRGKHLRSASHWREPLPYDVRTLDNNGEACLENNPDLSVAATRIAKAALKTAIGLARVEIDPDSSADCQEETRLAADALGKLRVRLAKDCLSPKEWRAVQRCAKIEGIHLYELGFWNLLQHCLRDTPDEFLFLHDAIGYESLVSNSNAATAIPVFLGDFVDKKYWTLKGGMDAIPRMLAFHCRRADIAAIADHHEVEMVTLVREGDDHFFELTVRCTPSLLNPGICYPSTFRAKNLILALPKQALEKLKLSGFESLEEAVFRERLEHVTAHRAFKLFLRYPRPWWSNELGLKARAITDLPIRQVYYLGEDDRANDEALVMASYSDEHYVDFWTPLVEDPQRAREAINLKELAMSQKVDITAYAASRRIINKAAAQLALMHKGSGTAIPDSTFGVVKQWNDAWHFWNVHEQPWETAEYLVQPFKSVRMFVCGEAYSLEQGWAEGALKSAERVLQVLGLGLPSWVDEPKSGEFMDYISH